MRVIQYYDKGWRMALMLDRTSTKRGREFVHIIPMTSKQLRIVKLPADAELEFKYLDYDIQEAKRRFLEFAARHGGTESALKEIEK